MERIVRTSVIVPVYNTEKYLGECVGSILAQTDGDFELILVDDGSSDSSGELCDKLAASDSRIMVVHKENGGLSSARNAGLKVASAQRISFVDSDDMLHPLALEIFNTIMDESGADIVRGGYFFAKSCRFGDIPSKEIDLKLLSPFDAVEATLYQTYDNSACSRLYRRDLMDSEEWFVPGLYYEDLQFFYRAYLKAKKIAMFDEKVYFYRSNGESFLHRWSEHRLDVLRVVDEIENFAATSSPELLAAARDRKFSASYNIFLLAGANGRPDVAARCWKIVRKYAPHILRDNRSRRKNRLGALLSYLGPTITRLTGNILQTFLRNRTSLYI